MRASEEQPDFLGYCRHCQAPMFRIDGEIRSGSECIADGHAVERRGDLTEEEEYE